MLARAVPLRFCEQHFAKLAAAVVALAAFNLAWRLDHEFVSEWDESLYAMSAWEMVRSGKWASTTFLGHLDYYNVKPPLNVWLIALSFKTFGVNLVSMRIVSTISACCTVAVLQVWARRVTQCAAVALLAGLVLSTSFAFVYVHAGRSGNTDSLFTLLILLAVVVMWAAQERAWAIAWLGPIAAGVFLLKGMAVLMPLSIVMALEIWRCTQHRRREWAAALCAVLLFALPVGTWMWARWQVDQSKFFERLFFYDFVGGTLTALEGHAGGPLFYADVLQKYQYDWLLGAAGVLWVARLKWRDVKRQMTSWRNTETVVLLSGWAAAAILIPTLMRTKNSWYLQPFYPLFALGVAWLIVFAFKDASDRVASRRVQVILVIVMLAFGVVEGRLIAYSHWRRDLDHSAQGVLLAERRQLSGHLVLKDHWNYADIFVVRALVGAEYGTLKNRATVLDESHPGDFVLSSAVLDTPELVLVGSSDQWWLYRRVFAHRVTPDDVGVRTGYGPWGNSFMGVRARGSVDTASLRRRRISSRIHRESLD